MTAVAAIVIGRNEGKRLVRCLKALEGLASPLIYVDSGSTDGSVEVAQSAGAEVVELDMTRPFTAARARNAGLAKLGENAPAFVQVIDGDCEIRQEWLPAATRFLDAHPEVAAVAGRLRETDAQATIWNRLADAEWETPCGEVRAIGGIGLLRRAAIADVGGYREDLIAGEEPELCLRLRHAGWLIWRLPDEMAWHDIAMTRFGQWWKRTKRGGHAFAESAALHGSGPEPFRVRELRSALFWGAGVPVAAAVGTLLFSPWALLVLAAWPLQVLRLAIRGMPLYRAFFLTLGKIPEAQGAIEFFLGRLSGRRQRLIDYKT
jgi:GT2 family glycosyltransferase